MSMSPVLPDLRHVGRDERSRLTRELFALLAEDPGPDRRAELQRQVITVNLRVAHAVATRYRGRGVEAEDLEQSAAHGLVKAVGSFDPGRGKDFLTYAVPTIRGEVQRYFRDRNWTIRPPRGVQELQWQVAGSIERLTGELGRDPLPAEVVDDLDITYAEYAEAVSAFGCFRPPSLDQPVGDGGSDPGALRLGDSLAATTDELEAAETRLLLRPVLACLSPQDRRLLDLRFFEGRTQKQIGAELGIVQTQVSRRLSQLLVRLRAEIGSTADEALAS